MAVTAEVRDRVGWISLDRPPANSYDAGFLEELDQAIGQVAEAEVAVAVVRSASGKFFSAGADVKAFLERSADENMVMCRRAHQVLDRFAAEAPLFVAAIAGHALGGVHAPGKAQAVQQILVLALAPLADRLGVADTHDRRTVIDLEQSELFADIVIRRKQAA
jgi:glycine/D-amino acid oxidase-like deaminating enzyme